MKNYTKTIGITIMVFLSVLSDIKCQSLFAPDFELNGMLKIEDTTGLSALVPKGISIQQYVNDSDECIYVLFTNNSCSEYAKAILHEGTHFTFYEFEVGTIDDLSLAVPYIRLPIDHSITESQIRLGMAKEEIVRIKGDNILFSSDRILSYDYNEGNISDERSYQYVIKFDEGAASMIHFGFLPL